MKVLRDSTIRRDIDHRTQAEGEPISDFADCFLYLVRHLRHRPEEDELVEMFLQNVRNDYRRYIAPRRPWSIEQCIEVGQDYERILETDAQFKEPPPRDQMCLPEAGLSAESEGTSSTEGVTDSSDGDESSKPTKRKRKKPRDRPKAQADPQSEEESSRSSETASEYLDTSEPDDGSRDESSVRKGAETRRPAWPARVNWSSYSAATPPWQGVPVAQGRGPWMGGQNMLTTVEPVEYESPRDGWPSRKVRGQCYICQDAGHKVYRSFAKHSFELGFKILILNNRSTPHSLTLSLYPLSLTQTRACMTLPRNVHIYIYE
uniref:Retrotransposon gag domain-containing protein n=1 Tax=Trichogramma kaykai TaxID=54128 RepID=A0ABD2VY06_9HYME